MKNLKGSHFALQSIVHTKDDSLVWIYKVNSSFFVNHRNYLPIWSLLHKLYVVPRLHSQSDSVVTAEKK